MLNEVIEKVEAAERSIVMVLRHDRDAIIQGHLYTAAQKMAEIRNLLVKVREWERKQQAEADLQEAHNKLRELNPAQTEVQ